MSQALLNRCGLEMARVTGAEVALKRMGGATRVKRFLLVASLVVVLLGGLGFVLARPVDLAAAGRYRYVATTGSDAGNSCLQSSAPCASLQRAVDQAANGDEIRIAAGTYSAVSQRLGFTQTAYITKNLVLRGGYTTSNWALANPSANPTILNAQGQGRVIYVAGGVVKLVGLRLTGGASGANSGGGAWNEAYLTVEDCDVYSNSGSGGAGIGSNGTLTVTRSRIYTNTVGGTGGAGILVQDGTAVIEDNTIYNNGQVGAGSGGGIQVSKGTVLIQRNRIYNNVVNGGGGLVIGLVSATNVMMRNNWIYKNTAVSGNGGGIFIYAGVLQSQNDTIYGNTALGSTGSNGEGGGVMYATGGSGIPYFTNTLFIANSATLANSGGGIGGLDTAVNVAYSDFFGNTPNPGHTGGTGNRYDRDPLFVNATTGDLHLQMNSPAIDTGLANLTSNDMEGQGRPFGSGIDRGADEYLTASSCYARIQNGAIYTNVQMAVDAAGAGSVVQVAGVCQGAWLRNGTTQTVYLNQNVTLRGGYTLTDWVNAQYAPTILDPQNGGRAVLITGTALVTVENFYITNGRARTGAGLFIGPAATAMVQNNAFYGNVATGDGGAVASVGPLTTLRYNTFYNNSAVHGGAIFGDSSISGNSGLLRNVYPVARAPLNPLLRLRAGDFNPLRLTLAVPEGLHRTMTEGNPQLYLVQFSGPIQNDWYSVMDKVGLKVVTYVPDYAYLVWGTKSDLDVVAAQAPVRWSGIYEPFYALHPDLLDSRKQSVNIKVNVMLYQHAGFEKTVQQILDAAVAEFAKPDEIAHYTILNVEVRGDQLDWLAGLPEVVSVDPWMVSEAFDEVGNQIIVGSLNPAGTQPLPAPSYLSWLIAQGFPMDPLPYPIVDITDDGIDNGSTTPLHPDFYVLGNKTATDRLIYNYNWTSSATANSVGGHGNINASIMGGYNQQTGVNYQDNNGFFYGLGVNPFGRIAGSKIINAANIVDVDASISEIVSNTYQLGSRISSNSWGHYNSGSYDIAAMIYDYMVRDAQQGNGNASQPMFILFAGGNRGTDGPATIASPGTAKNVLTVGAAEGYRPIEIDGGVSAADSAMDMADFSSRGPTADGRIKPDIVAPGTHIVGAASQDPEYTGNGVTVKYYPTDQTLYAMSSGTSHSTPAVAGAASLVYQYYQSHYGAVPSPAMIKAYLINSTRYLSGNGAGGSLPSASQGYGELNLAHAFNSAPFVVQDQKVLMTSSGQIYEIRGTVSDPSKPFRVVVAWTDAPGMTVAAPYVNDLDLEVEIGGQFYRGNNFFGALSVVGGVADTRNNVEAIYLPAGTTGSFVVRIRATNISGDGVPGNGISLDQDYALTIFNAVDSLIQLNSNVIMNNVASATSGGGGVYSGLTSHFKLNNNFLYNNTSGSGTIDPYGNVLAGTNDRLVNPGLVDPANRNFHLGLSSLAVSAGDPSAIPSQDYEGDSRPQGGLPDVGMDENMVHAEVDLGPDANNPRIYTDLVLVQGKLVTFTHTITNLGYLPSMRDTFTVNFANSDGWPVSLSGITLPLVLGSGESATFNLVVSVPATITDLYNRTWVTATSQTSAAATDSVVDVLARPGLKFTPNFTENADPGEVLTYTHYLTNTGGAPDVVLLETRSPLGWALWLTPTVMTVSLEPRQTISVMVRVQVPMTAATGLNDLMTITAKSLVFPGMTATVTDSTTANATVGTRYVATLGSNNRNNCTLAAFPCKAISYAVNQATWGDSILVGQGTYPDYEVTINQQVQLLGGYQFDGSSFILPGEGVNPSRTIIDAQHLGRGIHIQSPASARPVVKGFTIRNGTTSGVGGGIYVQGSSAPTLTQLIVKDSTASLGGGIYLDMGMPVLDHIYISSTVATDRGGGIFVVGGAQLFDGVHIFDAQAVRGGGLYVQGGTTVVSRSTFMSNTADFGGGIFHDNGSLALWNNFMLFNSANAGGALYKNQGTADVYHGSFYQNRATGSGGAIFDQATTSLTVWNSIFAENSAGDTGGGVYRQSAGTLAADYNALWNNSAGTSPDGTISFGTHLFNFDPQFIAPESGNLHLDFDSPLVDVGDSAGKLKSDIDGDIRPVNQGYDIGADEVSGCLARILRNPTQLYGKLQDAIDASIEGDTIQVSGICLGVVPRLVNGEIISQTAYISQNLTLVGGYNSRFNNDPTVAPVTTTLNARNQGRVIVISDTPGIDVSVVISRMILAHGVATGLGGYGGGVYNHAPEVTLAGVTISESLGTYGGAVANMTGTLYLGEVITENRVSMVFNQAFTQGGGVYVAGGSVIMANAMLDSNTAPQGAGIYNVAVGTLVTQTTFLGNYATGNGGAVYNQVGATLSMDRNMFIGNGASGNGGAVFNDAGAGMELFNSIFGENSAQNGGGLYNQSVNTVLRHNTFYFNHAALMGGGVYHSAVTTQPIINSTLIISNTAGSAGSGIYSNGAKPAFDYNDVYGNEYGGTLGASDGIGNLNINPRFISVNSGEKLYLHLDIGSPVEDVADPRSPLMEDIEGDPRPSSRNYDIGADEIGSCYIRINGTGPLYGNMQVAIRAARARDTLFIAGICSGASPVVSGTQTLTQMGLVTKALGFQGGFTLTDWVNPDPLFQPTLLNALGVGRVFYIGSNVPVTISGLEIAGGYADQGGAIFMAGGYLTVTKSSFYSNTATAGGVLYNQGGQVTMTRELKITDNEAQSGGVFYTAGGTLFLNGLNIYSNRATADGGVLFHAGGTAVLQNMVFRGNRAGNRGGVVFNQASTQLTFRHNTLYNNSATDGGGFYTTNASPYVRNSIFMNNSVTGSGQAIYSSVAYTVDYNNVYPPNGYGGSVISGSHSVGVDPLFVNAYLGDFHLKDTSPVFDLGDPAMTLYYDYDNMLRPGDQGFDLGAFERPSCRALLVRTNVVYGNLQWAINNSQPGDEIQVSADYPCRGVHPFQVNSSVISQTIHVTHSLRITGGYTYTVDGVFKPDSGKTTVLDALGLGRVLLITNTRGVTMSLFTLLNGTAARLGGGPTNSDSGGAIYYRGTGAWLDQVFVKNGAAVYGGGMLVAGSGLTVTGSSFISNQASMQGGGLFNYGGSIWVIGGTLADNRASGEGGGIYNGSGYFGLESTTVATNTAQNGGGLYDASGGISIDAGNRFYSNRATLNGGALYLTTGNPQVRNSSFFFNTASYGAAIYVNGGMPGIMHDTFFKNHASNLGGAIRLMGGTTTIQNSIFDTNEADGNNGGNAIYASAGLGTLDHNDYYPDEVTAQIFGGIDPGITNFNLKPLFVNSFANNIDSLDFHLEEDSPLIDIAANSAVSQDMDRHPRPINTAADIGADEFAACLVRVESNQKVYGRIADAISHAISGDRLRVAMGICIEQVTLRMPLDISGSWLKDFSRQTDPEQGEPWIASAIDANRLGTVLWADNSQTGTIQLSRVALQRGLSTDGAGLFVSPNVTVTVRDASIRKNEASRYGGGGYLSVGSDVQLLNVLVYSNTATMGGGLYNAANSFVYLSGGDLSMNHAIQLGGGLYDAGSTLSIVNQGFSDNTADSNGGGAYISEPGMINYLVNMIVTENHAVNGGGIYNARSSANFQHATVWKNQATGDGGGIYNVAGGVTVNASIIDSNVASSGGGIYSSQPLELVYSLIWNNELAGVSAGDGNLFEAPRYDSSPYVQPALGINSPAIDAVPVAQSPVSFDAMNNARPSICTKDMGAYEYVIMRRSVLWDGVEPTAGEALPGRAVTYTFSVRNNNEHWLEDDTTDSSYGPGTGYTETARITVTSSTGWAQIVQIKNAPNPNIVSGGKNAIFDLGPSAYLPGSAQIVVRVNIPADAPIFMTDTTSLSVDMNLKNCPESYPVLSAVSAPAVTTVKPDYAFNIWPDNYGTASPGQTLTYTHYISNLGNTTSTFNLFTNAFYAVAEVISPTSGTLTLLPGEQSGPIVVSLTIRPETAGGLVDVTNLLAQPAIPGLEPKAVADNTTIQYITGTRYVATTGTDSLIDESPVLGENLPDNNCTQWQVGACRTLQQALAQAQNGDVIKVAQGTYTDTYAVYNNQSQLVTQTAFISKSVTVDGGYNAAQWLAGPNAVSNTTIISAAANARAIYIAPNVTVTLSRLVLQGGSAVGLGGGSSGEDAGGNLYHQGGNLMINAVRFRLGTATLGAGMYSGGGTLRLQNSVFDDNGFVTPATFGGGVYIYSGTAVLWNNTFFGNVANSTGGAFFMPSGSLTFRNNIVSDNYSGGGSLVKGLSDHAAVHLESGTANSDYNIYWQNTLLGHNTVVVSGTHDRVVDPLFTNVITAPMDLSLMKTSPARDIGDPATNLIQIPTDYLDHGRSLGLGVDIGAYEYVPQAVGLLDPDYNRVTGRGTTLLYTHTLTNVGEFTDTFDITISSTRGWGALVTGTPINLPAGMTATVVARVVVPLIGTGGLTDVTVLTATSRSNPTGLDTARDTTVVTQVTGLQFTPHITNSGVPGSVLVYTHYLTNTGDGPDTYNLSYVSSHGWPVTVTSPISLNAGEMTTVLVTVTIPTTSSVAISGTTDIVTVTATSQSNSATSAFVRDTTLVNRVWGVMLEPDYTQTLGLELQMTYLHWLTNTGNFTDSFALTSSSTQGWASINPAGTVQVGPGQSRLVTVTLTIPPGSGGLSDITTITATSTSQPAFVDTAVDRTTIQAMDGVLLFPDNTGATPSNSVITYTHTLSNAGNIATQVELSATNEHSWAISYSPMGTINLPVGAQVSVVVTVNVPAGMGGQTDHTWITATVVSNPIVTDSAVDTTNITQMAAVAFDPDRDGYTDIQPTAMVYTHLITNTGSDPDTYNFTWVSNQNWAVTVEPASIHLDSGESRPVTVTVAVPYGAGGITDTTTVTATSVYTTTAFDWVRDTTHVTRVLSLLMTADEVTTTDPGAIVTFYHVLTNTGNVTDTISLSGVSSNGWPGVSVNPAMIALGPGMTQTVIVSIGVPAGTLSDTVDSTVVTAISGLDAAVFAQVTDTITVRQASGVFFVPDRNGIGGLGQAVVYTHTLTNIGNSPDIYVLTSDSTQGWATITPPGPFNLAAGESQIVTVTVSVPATATNGTIDTTVVTATTQSLPVHQAAVTDTTTVQQRPGLIFTPDHSTVLDPGTFSYIYTHTLTNTGDGPDSFVLQFTTSQGWGSLVDAGPINLAAGESAAVRVDMLIPANAMGGVVDLSIITATSTISPALQAYVVDTTTARVAPALTLEKDELAFTLPGTTVTQVHTLSNDGNYTDTIALTAVSDMGWPTQVIPPSVILEQGGKTSVTVTVQVPMGTFSGTMNTTVVTATSGLSATVMDTVMDLITVTRMISVLVEPDWTRSAGPGTIITYTHYLTNTGNYTDSFTLNYSSSAGWGAGVPAGPVTLGPGASELVTITVTIPTTASIGQSDQSVVSAASQTDALVFDMAHDQTDLMTSPGLIFQPDRTAGSDSGRVVTYTHTLTNTGNGTDSFDITYSSTQGWASLLTPNLVVLNANQTATVQLAVSIPAGTVSGTVDISMITATSRFIGGTPPSARVVDTTTVRGAASVVLEPDRSGTGLPGNWVTYTHTITNVGNVTDTFTLGGSSVAGWTVNVTPASVMLGPQAVSPVTVTVLIPAGTVSGTVDSTVVMATSVSDAAIFDSVTDQTTVGRLIRFELEAPQASGAYPGTAAVYSHVLTNSGNFTETFSLTSSSVPGWATVLPLGDVTLAPGQTQTVTVTVNVPSGAGVGEVETTTVTATAQSDLSFDSLVDLTGAIRNAGLLFAPDQTGMAGPMTTITYTHTLTNTGDGLDSYTLTVSSSQGWARLLDGPVVSAGVGQTTTVRLAIDVPLGAIGGLQDITIITATSRFSNVVQAGVVDTTTVPVLVGVVLDPDQQRIASPSSTVIFTHVVTNTGTVTDSFALSARSSNGWVVQATPISVTLAPGFTAPVTVAVTVPSGLVSGTQDTTTVTATSQANNQVFDIAVDLTTINAAPMRYFYLPIVVRNYNPNRPDLVVKAITFNPDVPVAGQPVTVSVVVVNEGPISVTTGNNFYVDFYVNRVPRTLLQGDLSWGVQGSWFTPGRVYTLSKVYTFTGSAVVYAQIDTDNSVQERDESNNVIGPLSINLFNRFEIREPQPAEPIAPERSAPRPTPTPMP